MDFQISEGLANIQVTALKDALNDGYIRLYGSPVSQVEADALVPASASAALGSATLLCQISAEGSALTFDSTVTGGIAVKNTSESWAGVNEASGYVSFYRFVLPDDTGAEDPSAVRAQGTVGILNKDLILSSSYLTLGEEQRIDSYIIGQPQ